MEQINELFVRVAIEDQRTAVSMQCNSRTPFLERVNRALGKASR
jgi:hypothetical protein